MYILIFILVLGVVVLIHELGHFLFARRAGILAHEFSIGMGPALYKFKKGETVYAIRAIPIGGYVSAAGEDPETARIKTGQTVFLQIEQNVVRKIYFYRPEGVTTKEALVVDFDLYGKEGTPLFIKYEDEAEVKRTVVAEDAFYVFKEGQEIQIAPYDRCYESKSWISRFLFVVMGAGFNFILATLIFILLNFITGIPSDEPVIVAPHENTPADVVELEAGDRIISLNGVPIDEWSDISEYMVTYTGDAPLTIEYERNGVKDTKVITPLVSIKTIGIQSNLEVNNNTIIGYVGNNSNADKEGLEAGDKILSVNNVAVSNWREIQSEFEKYYMGEEITLSYMRVVDGNEEINELTITTIKALEKAKVSSHSIGISPVYEFNFIQSITGGFKQTYLTIASVFDTLGLLFGNENVTVRDLSGPVGIFDMTKTFAMGGFISILSWTAFISANIGFVNLLPFPALDGGRLIFLVIEGITGKPVNRKVEGYIHAAGFALFMLLFLYITFNDVLRLRG